MLIKKVYTTVSIILLIISSSSAQIASLGKFPPAITTICQGYNLPALLTGGSVGDTFILDYGGGEPLDTMFPPLPFFINHVYNTTGNPINIVLTALKNGNIDRDTIKITVLESPKAKLGFTSDSICLGQSITFTDSSTFVSSPIISWTWNYGDDTYIDTIPNPSTHTYSEYAKTFSTKLTVVNQLGCSKTKTQNIIITADTTLATDITATSSCPCNAINFSPTGTAISWQWDFADGNTSTSNNSTNIYAAPGDYNIRLTGKDNAGCLYYLKKKVTVCGNDIKPLTSKSNIRWYFSRETAIGNAGLDFSSGSPVPVFDSKMFTPEGSATISDPITGNLLFYTSGEFVYNAVHDTMANGDSLFGGNSSAQACLIVPNPGNIDQYYIFTNAQGGSTITTNNRLHYSLVDMSFNVGLGEVISKNIEISSIDLGIEGLTGKEKTRATCNSAAEYWIATLIKDISGNWYVYSYLINTTGIASPIITWIPYTTPGTTSMQFSNNGRTLAIGGGSGTYLFDFDNNTGIVTEKRKVNYSGSTYGVNFSPDDTKLYSSSLGGAVSVKQFDLNVVNIDNTITNLYTGGGQRATISKGIDNKLYIATPYNNVSVVNDPNNLGLSCNYADNSLSLGGRQHLWGLQNIVQLNLPVEDTFFQVGFTIDTPTCPSFTRNFIVLDTSCHFHTDNFQSTWYFGDGDSLVNTTLQNTSHTYSNPGTYSIMLVRTKDCYLSDTIVNTLIIDTIPAVSFVSDTVCANTPTNFISTVLYIDSIQTYTWDNAIQDSVANPIHTFTDGGSYTVYLLITDTSGCTYGDTNNVMVNYLPIAFAGPDTTICDDGTVILTAGLSQGGNNNINDTIKYLWTPTIGISDSNISNPSLNPNNSQIYTVFVSNNCGTDSAYANINETSCDIFIPNAFSPNGDGTNDIFRISSNGIKDYLLKIYDRWGNIVFESHSQSDSWNGNYQKTNKTLSEGVYVFWLKTTLLNNIEIEKRGNLSLVK